MEFEETDKELDDDLVSPDDLLSEESGLDDIDLLSESSVDTDDEALSELEELEKKDRARLAAKRSLKVRRAIEDFFEERKVKHELDYLFEDDDLTET